jgi:hypothetical protein
MTKSRSETASSELAIGRSKPSAFSGHVAVDRERRAGKRGRAKRDSFRRLRASANLPRSRPAIST